MNIKGNNYDIDSFRYIKTLITHSSFWTKITDLKEKTKPVLHTGRLQWTEEPGFALTGKLKATSLF